MPTDTEVQALIADVAAILERVDAFATALSTAQRSASPKMRAGGERIVATVAQLAEQYGMALPAVSGADMKASLSLAQRLRPLADTSRQLTRRLEDTITNAQGECWWAATALYSALARVSGANPALEAALRPVVAFFARGKRKKAPPMPVKPPGSSTPPVASAA
jgi:hypothetical protein